MIVLVRFSSQVLADGTDFTYTYAIDQNIQYDGTVTPTTATDNAITATIKPKTKAKL